MNPDLLTNEELLILIAGYIRGLETALRRKPDQVVIQALKRIGCPEKYLPKESEK